MKQNKFKKKYNRILIIKGMKHKKLKIKKLLLRKKKRIIKI